MSNEIASKFYTYIIMKEIPRDTCIYFKSEQRSCACERLQPTQRALAPQGFSGRL